MAKPIPASTGAPRRRLQAPANPNPEAFFTQAEADAMLAAKDRAVVSNPAEVRRAMLATPRKIKGVTIRVADLGSYLLLEEMESPLLSTAAPATFYDTVAAAFVLAHPLEGAQGKFGEGAPAFRAAVVAWAARHFTPADLEALTVAVTAALFIGFDPAGGADADAAKKNRRRSPTGGR